MNTCTHCGEDVLPDEQHPSFLGEPMHMECGFRVVGGSVAHLEKRCSCYVPGSNANDPPGLTKRQAARAAFDLWNSQNPIYWAEPFCKDLS